MVKVKGGEVGPELRAEMVARLRALADEVEAGMDPWCYAHDGDEGARILMTASEAARYAQAELDEDEWPEFVETNEWGVWFVRPRPRSEAVGREGVCVLALDVKIGYRDGSEMSAAERQALADGLCLVVDGFSLAQLSLFARPEPVQPQGPQWRLRMCVSMPLSEWARLVADGRVAVMARHVVYGLRPHEGVDIHIRPIALDVDEGAVGEVASFKF